MIHNLWHFCIKSQKNAKPLLYLCCDVALYRLINGKIRGFGIHVHVALFENVEFTHSGEY